MGARILRFVPPAASERPASPSGRRRAPDPDADAGTPTVLHGRARTRTATTRRDHQSASTHADATVDRADLPAPDATESVDPEPVDLEAAARLAEARGYEAGLERARSELADAIATAGAMARMLERRAPREASTLAHSIVELGLALARRVVDAELRTDPTILVRAVEQAVGALNGSGDVRVLVHPSAVEAVRDAWADRHGTAHLGRAWSFEPDPSLGPGGCLVRLDHGFVDAGLETQLEELGIALDAAIPALAADDADPGPDAGDLARPTESAAVDA